MEDRYEYVDKPKSAFEARDNWDHEILAMGYKLSATASSVYQFIISHTMYSGDFYGYLDVRYCGQEIIGKLNGGRDRKSIGRALKDLQDMGLIGREQRHDPVTGNRYEDSIYVRMNQADRGVRYSAHLGHWEAIKAVPRDERPKIGDAMAELGSYEMTPDEADDFLRAKVLTSIETMSQNDS